MSDMDTRGFMKHRTAVVDIGSGDATANVLLDIRDEETFSIDYLKVEYDSAGSVASDLELHDNDSGTSAGSLDNRIEKFKIQAGDRIVLEDAVYDDIEDDLVLNPDGNQDNEVTVTVSGRIITG